MATGHMAAGQQAAGQAENPQDEAEQIIQGDNGAGERIGAASASGSLEQQWSDVRTRLRAELGLTTFNSWIGHLSMVSMEEARVTLSVPTRFLRDWIRTHYLAHLERAWVECQPGIKRIDILISEKKDASAA